MSEYLEKAKGPFNGQDRALLARLDERTTGMVTDINTIKESFVTKDAFFPVKMLVYGMVATAMTGVFGALLALVIK